MSVDIEKPTMLELTTLAPSQPRLSDKLGFVAGELGNSFLKAGGTTLRIGGGVLAGATTTLVFGMVSSMAFNGPNVVGTTIAQTAAIAMSGPFVHHVFKSKLAENINPAGAFTRATKATSYALAGIFAPLTLLGIGAPSAAPEDFTPPSEFEQNFTPPTRPPGGRYNIA